MRVIPVLDLLRGQAVYAQRGERDSYKSVSPKFTDIPPGNALSLARAYREELGFQELYIADLDAITGAAPPSALIHEIAQEGTRIWLDAGIATAGQALRAFELGAERAIVGLETLSSLSALPELVSAAGADRLVFSLDLRAGTPFAPLAPPDLASLPPVAIAELAARAGFRTIIALDLTRVGTATGIDTTLIRHLRHALPTHELIAGGGLRSPAELHDLAQAGADGVLVGRGIYEDAGFRRQDSGRGSRAGISNLEVLPES
jgi:phosphoribosylformimino-5-aminoimidazole carboxamide ribotide isomerase